MDLQPVWWGFGGLLGALAGPKYLLGDFWELGRVLEASSGSLLDRMDSEESQRGLWHLNAFLEGRGFTFGALRLPLGIPFKRTFGHDGSLMIQISHALQ